MKLEIIKGEEPGKKYKCSKETPLLIGRDKKCTISINDTKSSRQHAKVYFDGVQFMIEDLNSTNGTIVNGKNIFKEALSENDEIMIGDTYLLVIDLDDSESSSSTSVKFHEEGSSTIILTTVPHKEADLLAGNTTSTRLVDDLVLENNLLRKVGEISQIMAGQKDSQGILVSILDLMQNILKADTACIMIWSEEDSDWIIRATARRMSEIQRVNVSRTIIQQALNEGVAILTTDPMSDGRFDPSMSIISEGVSSALCSPLKIEDKFHGVMFFDRRKKEEVFTAMDLRFTATVANILGIFLENEKLEIESRKKARLAVIGEVIAGLAHHTKNIITGLRFSINALEIAYSKKQNESVERCLKSITMQERKISEMVLNMLTYSKDRVPVRSTTNLKTVIEDTVEPYKNHMAEIGILFEFTSPQSPMYCGDENLLSRVFLNLLVNSMDCFKYKKQAGQKLIRVTIEQKSNKDIIVTFYDTGCGISKASLDRLFTVFYSTKGAEGTGLGLAVVHKIIQEHGGKILVSSKEDEWTEFKIILPFVESSNS